MKKSLYFLCTAVAITHSPLNAMYHHSLQDSFQAASKKQGTLNITCGNGTIWDVPVSILHTSKMIAQLIQDIDQVPKTLTFENIKTSTMLIMIKYMNIVTIAQTQNRCTSQIIAELVARIRPKIFKLYSPEIIQECLDAASFLDFNTLREALCLLVGQDMKEKAEQHSNSTMLDKALHFFGTQNINKTPDLSSRPDIKYNIQKAYMLNHQIQFDPKNPIVLSLHDVMEYAPDRNQEADEEAININVNNVYAYTISLIANGKFDVLQETLDCLSCYANTLSIQAHQALVDYLKDLRPTDMIDLFERIHHQQSTLGMALQLLYAQQNQANLHEALDCVELIATLGLWVNNNDFSVTTPPPASVCQANLPYLLPLIEPLLAKPVERLYLFDRGLNKLPVSIGNLTALKTLFCGNNKLTTLPNTIGSLINLEEFDLGQNQLTCLPESFCNLTALKKLWLQENQLGTIPKSLAQLANVNTIKVSKNPLPEETKEWLYEQFGHSCIF